jgi:hypothetical protein
MEFEFRWLNELPATYFDQWDGPQRAKFEETRNGLLALGESLPLSWYWTLRLAEAFEIGGLGNGQPLPPGFLWSSVGLIQSSESNIGHFGIILYVDDRVQIPDEYRDLDPFTVGGQQFPVVARRVTLEDHRSVAAPRDGTVSVAKTRTGGPHERVGWLTAAHVVEGFSYAAYEDGSTGAILDRGPGCIDVALIQDTGLASAFTVIPVMKAITMGTPGSFTGNKSGSHAVTVTDISTSLGVLKASALPVRVGLSSHGVQGDSGARVDAANGSVVGVYLGKYIDSGGNSAGLAQMADQLQVLMGARFLR